jgi:N-acylneuraminate cytidylyltransferase
MSSVAIIPARGGSKRIPRKNIKNFLGKPIIAYSIETAVNSKLFDEVMVSTDDKEIAEIAKEYGAKVPFFRSDENSNDYVGLAGVITEVLQAYSARETAFETFCCILPTAPLLIENDLIETKQKLIVDQLDTVLPVVRFGYPIQRCLQIEDNKISMVWPEHYDSRSQDLEPRFHDCGLFYWGRSSQFLQTKRLFSKNSGCVEIPETRVQDVDTLEDWQICELKYRLLHA